MTERQLSAISGRINNRSEYTFGDEYDQKYRTSDVFDTVDVVLHEQRAVGQPNSVFEHKDGVSTRELQLSDDTPVSFSEIAVRMSAFREGLVTESVEVAVNEYMKRSSIRFLSQYSIELFKGGGVSATFVSHDPTNETKFWSRRMRPYDYDQLKKQLHTIHFLQTTLITTKSHHTSV